MNGVTINEEDELLYSSLFSQIQECGDIISSILLIYKFVTENQISTQFNPDKLRGIALRSCDDETSTYLWHINAVIAASADFEHLLIGIEVMFERYLGNKLSFIQQKEREREQTKNEQNTKNSISSSNKHKFVGNEVYSVVNSYYNKQENNENNENDERVQKNMAMTPAKTTKRRMNFGDASNDENDENKETRNNLIDYRGKISSPISFRMRQQKRMIQSERKVTSRNASVDIDAVIFDHDKDDHGDDDENCDNLNKMINSQEYSTKFEPEILSPFNVHKFAKTVDLTNDTAFHQQKHMKIV